MEFSDDRAHHPPEKYVAVDSFNEDGEGALRTITIGVDPAVDKYYVVMPGLPMDESTIVIEQP